MKNDNALYLHLNQPSTGGEEEIWRAEAKRLRERIRSWQDAMDKVLEDKQIAEEEHKRSVALLEGRIAELEKEAEMWRERALVAEAKLEGGSATTIVYNNYAQHGGDVMGGQQNNTNQTSDMNIETLNINGGQNQIGDNGTMNIHNGGETRAHTTPADRRVKEALMEMTAQEGWEKQKWWAVWKVLMSLKIVNKNAREFAEYLINLEVTQENIYENIRKLDAELCRISSVEPAQWLHYSGRYSDNYQKQIDTARRLLELMKPRE